MTTEGQPSIEERLANIEAHLQVNNQMLIQLMGMAFGGGGGAGGPAGDGGAGGGGGGAAGGAGGIGGIVNNVSVFTPSPALVEWVQTFDEGMATELQSQDPVERLGAMRRLLGWLAEAGRQVPASVARILGSIPRSYPLLRHSGFPCGSPLQDLLVGNTPSIRHLRPLPEAALSRQRSVLSTW